MRLAWCVWINETHTQCCTLRVSNRPLAILSCLFQLCIASASLLQHILSLYLYKNILLCRSNIDESSSPWETVFLAYDIIIFDFGLMHRVLGTEECVANYLDGGYMRSLWCIQHSTSLLLAFVPLLLPNSPIWLLWPVLLIQSSYSLGLSVLTMATAPKLLDAVSGDVDASLIIRFMIYLGGFMFNWLFTFIMWHHYWMLEKKREGRRARREDSFDSQCQEI